MQKTFQAYRLKKPVSCKYPDFWGRPSALTLEEGVSSRWTWKPSVFSSHTIEPHIVGTESRRMQLDASGQKLEVYEHIGVLRFGGLRGVTVVGNGWPPYHGRAHELWLAAKAELQPDNTPLPLYTVSESVRCNYPDRHLNGSRCFTEIGPSSDGTLTLDIAVKYDGIGYCRQIFNLPDPILFDKICAARTLGWPRSNYWIGQATRRIWWPHFDAIAWPQNTQNDDLLNEIVLHRAQDLLGALSLLCVDGIFVGRIVSRGSGHWADVNVVRAADELLCRLDI